MIEDKINRPRQAYRLSFNCTHLLESAGGFRIFIEVTVPQQLPPPISLNRGLNTATLTFFSATSRVQRLGTIASSLTSRLLGVWRISQNKEQMLSRCVIHISRMRDRLSIWMNWMMICSMGIAAEDYLCKFRDPLSESTAERELFLGIWISAELGHKIEVP